ncbi:hypothetical protein ACFO4N_03990 [Camelliibacillus cellulosilyticus]|uniref:Uncharacterized protein n=1 Tax=Camelliibacillus cellulosilyticus TaxID=2174486 RepID=A0ABV9GIE3_9BACL
MKSKTFLILFFLVIVCGAVLIIKPKIFHQHSKEFITVNKEVKNDQEINVKSFTDMPDKEITLLEAFNLCLKIARKYDKKPKLIYLGSVDDKKLSGGDGKKGNWQGVLALPKVNHHMVIVIESGKLKNYRFIDSSDEYFIPISYLKTDSSQIIVKAKKQFNLQPSPKDDPFSHGFHYRIFNDGKHIFFAVDGQINGQAAEIYFSPQNGQYIGRTEHSLRYGRSKLY